MMLPSTVSRCDLLDYGDYEDRHDAAVNQMLVPRSHQEDATIVLNNLLKEYDKTLRPDIGGKAGRRTRRQQQPENEPKLCSEPLESQEELRSKCVIFGDI